MSDLRINPDVQEGEELIEKTEVPGTPFTIIGINDEYFGVMGKYRLTEKSETKALVEAELKQITWNRIVQVVSLLINQSEEIKSFINEN